VVKFNYEPEIKCLKFYSLLRSEAFLIQGGFFARNCLNIMKLHSFRHAVFNLVVSMARTDPGLCSFGTVNILSRCDRRFCYDDIGIAIEKFM